VILRATETGTVIAETSLQRGTAAANIETIRLWYTTVATKVSALPPISRPALLRRLADEGHCSELLELSSRPDFLSPADRVESDTAADKCRLESSRTAPSPAIPLHVRAENVGPHHQQIMFDRALNSKLAQELQTFYRQTAELHIVCAEECAEGGIRLSLPYDPDWYRAQSPDRKFPLRPYEPLARALIAYRDSLRNIIGTSKFPMEIVLTTGASILSIDVGAMTSGSPRLTSKTDASAFFQPES
jgi:hypothetical protein